MASLPAELRQAEAVPQDVVAPKWFTSNIEAPRLDRFVDVSGCPIHYLLWPCRPTNHTDQRQAGLIFLHGNGAHAHWFTFLAPFFTRDYSCVSLSMSGNGESGWRDEYSFSMWGSEIEGVARDAGFLDSSKCRAKPIVIAHSMGVIIAMALAKSPRSELFGGFIFLDELPRPDGYFDGLPSPPWIKREGSKKHKVRGCDQSPRVHFRLAPPQPEMNRYIMNFIADHSVQLTSSGNAPGNWVWAFDPNKDSKNKDPFPNSISTHLSLEAVRSLQVKSAFIVGERSAICTPSIVEFNRFHLGDAIPVIEIHDSAHHVMIDQPLSLVSTLASILCEWKRSALVVPGGTSITRTEERVLQSDWDVARKLTWKDGNFVGPALSSKL